MASNVSPKSLSMFYKMGFDFSIGMMYDEPAENSVANRFMS